MALALEAVPELLRSVERQLAPIRATLDAIESTLRSAIANARENAAPGEIVALPRTPAIRDTERQTAAYYCSFCGKSQHEVRKLIAGPTVFICDECVELCSEIVGKPPAGGAAEP